MTTKRRFGTALYYVISVFLAVAAMIPFLWMVSTSFKSRGALMSIPIEWIPKEPSLKAYIKVFSKFPFARTIGNSLFISLAYTVITLLSASMQPLPLPRFGSPGTICCFGSTWLL